MSVISPAMTPACTSIATGVTVSVLPSSATAASDGPWTREDASITAGAATRPRRLSSARGDRSLSEPGGSSFGHVQLSDAPRVCETKAVGTGVKFRDRIGGTAATDERPHELRE